VAVRPKRIYGIIFLKLSKQRPLISVAVATHQRPNLLGRALHSLTSQEFVGFEIVLCSDSSDVATADVALQFLRPTDTFLMAPGRSGSAETRNLGLQLCRGEWICFLDDDDTFDAKYFSNIVSRLAGEGGKIHYVNYSRISEQRGGEKGLFLRDKAYIDISAVPLEKLFIQNFIPNNSIFCLR
jgi:glycosyltransferase involved in cell wall biosynthesis